MSERKLDGRLAWDVESLARWWTSAAPQARLQLCEQAIKAGTPPFDQLRIAIILAETEAGEVAEG